MRDEYLNAKPHEGLPPILSMSLGVPIFREQLHWLGASLLNLNIDETNAFAKMVQTQPEGEWIGQVKTALLDRGLSQEWTTQFCDRIGRWAVYLFPLSHALGIARLAGMTRSK